MSSHSVTPAAGGGGDGWRPGPLLISALHPQLGCPRTVALRDRAPGLARARQARLRERRRISPGLSPARVEERGRPGDRAVGTEHGRRVAGAPRGHLRTPKPARRRTRVLKTEGAKSRAPRKPEHGRWTFAGPALGPLRVRCKVAGDRARGSFGAAAGGTPSAGRYGGSGLPRAPPSPRPREGWRPIGPRS